MDGSVGIERSAAEALVRALEKILAELTAMDGGDTSWVRPLAVLTAEIEYRTLRSRRFDPSGVRDQCRELHHLLASPRSGDGEFASRYARARLASSAIGTLHERALAACRTVAAGTASSI